MFTLKQLHEVLPLAGAHADEQYPFLMKYMLDFGIGGTLYDLSAFIATIGHESDQFRHTTEMGGDAYFTKLYEGREDLGNTEPGDGALFEGRGDIQETGRANVTRVRDRLRARYGARVPDFVRRPEALAEPEWAVASACDYWSDRGLTALANQPNFRAVTKRVNGGYNGWENRNLLYTRALRVFGTPDFSNVQSGVDSTAKG
jgi:putative chitinase